MLNQPPREDDRDHAVRAAFGGPLSPEMAREMERRFGLKVYTGFYGMTEAIGVTYLDVAEMERLKQAGYAKQVDRIDIHKSGSRAEERFANAGTQFALAIPVFNHLGSKVLGIEHQAIKYKPRWDVATTGSTGVSPDSQDGFAAAT